MNLKEELKTYETELGAVQKQLDQIEEQKQKMIRHGVRIEGIVAFLKQSIEAQEKAEKAEKPEEKPAEKNGDKE